MFLTLFCLTIPAANWMIGHIGTACLPNGPCVVPVAPGILAPSGVLLVGAALVLRDLVQRRLGIEFGIAAIVAGAVLSVGFAPRSWVLASAAAFPLARRRLVLAVLASSMAGLVVDSLVFLWLAFGSLDYLPGQLIGKAWMVLLSVPFVAYLRRRDERLGLNPV
jgi:uncharacterized PurR-regulated membrane protein YhhQ (DUF165 family)